MKVWKILDKYNPHKVWIIKRYADGHYVWNQQISGKMHNRKFYRVNKWYILDVLGKDALK